MSNYQKLVNGVWVDDLEAQLEGLRASIDLAGKYTGRIIRANGDIEDFDVKNICTTQGLVSLLNTYFAGSGAITNWYLGLFQNNYTPVGSDTAATFNANASEFTGYSGGARPAFSPATATSTPSSNNSASPATFTFTSGATIYGAFLASTATLGGSGGILFSAAQFGSSKNVSSGDQLILTYSINAATA